MIGLKKIINIKHIIELLLMMFLYAVLDNVGSSYGLERQPTC